MRLLEILKERAFEKKPVTLASGRKSNFYIDVKRVSLDPEGAALIGEGLFTLIQKNYSEAKLAGGLTLGADPLGAALAVISFQKGCPIPAFIVRKQPKSHGLQLWVEGGEGFGPGTAVVVLEDVVTTGKSALEAIEKIEPLGWRVLGVAAVVDRQEGGAENLKERGYSLYSLFRKEDFGILE